MIKPTLESAFAAIVSQPETIATMVQRLRVRFQEPHRAYHNEEHTLHVLACVYEWLGGEPSPALVAAALYHDSIYDPTQKDNEARSAELCCQELSAQRYRPVILDQIRNLIHLTAFHLPAPGDTNAILLSDADLHILGSTPINYESYRQAIRTEYNHVSESSWRVGRKQVLTRFLERPQIFHGNWVGVDEWESQARRNIANEITSLANTDGP